MAGVTRITASFHGYSVGDHVYFEGVEGATWLNGRIARVVEILDDDNFTVDIDPFGRADFTGDTGGTTRVGAPDPLPTPPTVPPVVPPPEPPEVGGGGGNQDRRYDDGSYP